MDISALDASPSPEDRFANKSLRLEYCLEKAIAESFPGFFSPNHTALGSNQTGPEIVISRSCPSLEHARGDPDLWFAAASVCRY